jgi:PiT family inorganic phosphate transporter
MIEPLLTAAVACTLLFSFTIGMKDGCNVMATVVGSRSISRGRALAVVLAAEFAGPFLLGLPVALTVARGILNIDRLGQGSASLLMLLSGVVGALVWNIFSWSFRLPTSSSFALVGGLVGPSLLEYGGAVVPWRVFTFKVIGALFLSPLVGMLAGYLIYNMMHRLLARAPLRTNAALKKLQYLGLVLLGVNHGTNDSQKAMGVIALLLLVAGKTGSLQIPLWVMLASVFSLVAGITMGGTGIIRTVGYGIARLQPVHSLASQASASCVLLLCNLTGAPVSTTQIISSSVIGVGNAYRSNHVRWSTIRAIFMSWIITIPMAGILAALIFTVLKNLLSGGIYP